MATVEQLERALRNADAAGDVEAARAITKALKETRAGGGQAAPASPSAPPAESEASNQWFGLGDQLNTIGQGMTFGFGDELEGVSQGLHNVLYGKGSFGEGYQQGRDRVRGSVDAYREANPGKAMALEIGGAIPTALLPVGNLARGAGLLSKIGTGAKVGAAYGGLYGAGAADGGVMDRVQGAATGAAFGGLTGGAIPLATAGVGAVARPVRDAVSARVNPSGYAARKVAERLSGDGVSVNQAANRVARSGQNGTNMALMDVAGNNTRSLARTASNVPGPAQNRLNTMGTVGSMRQGGRIMNQVRAAFGDGADYQAIKEQIIGMRSTRAKPLYDAAMSRPITFTRGLEELLNTPAGKAAMAAAKRNSQNSRQPWAQWFLNVADDGSIMDARRVPDMNALNQIKKSLWEAVEAAKKPADGSPFGRPMHTEASRAIKSVYDDLVGILDDQNPVYKQARQVAGETIQWDEALEVGRNALKTDPRSLASRVGKMSQEELELARIGLASAIGDRIESAGFTHNALNKVFASPRQVSQLRPFFRTQEEFASFRRAMADEARRQASYNAIRGNSTTARQLLDAQEAGQLGEVVQTGAAAATGSVGHAMINAIVSGLRRVSGLTPQTADEMARLLASRDPAQVRNILNTLRRIETSNASAEAKRNFIRQMTVRILSGQEGRALAPQTAPQ